MPDYSPNRALLIALLWVPGLLLYAQVATLSGTITDGYSEEPLAFVNVGIPVLGLGTTTELDGRYRITNIPPGTYTVAVSYLGYGTDSTRLTFAAAERKIYSTTLSEGSGLQLTEVVVTGQAEGQRAAINQQINSNTIVNVVSKEKLQELPDQNAAEAVGRLAGVSVYRDAGEGQRISVRGISPRLNSVTINGQRLPSTEANDRSVDLSMISPDMLEGIELFKALTPDRDGDAVGGSVNFTIAKARRGLRVNGRVLGGYNELADYYGNLRANASVSNRFGKDRFGFIATANYQRANRSNEFVASDYELVTIQDGRPRYTVTTLSLGKTDETRLRAGGSLTLDYTPSADHTIMFNATQGTTRRDRLRRQRRYRNANNEQEFILRDEETSTTLVSQSLNGEHLFGSLSLDWSGSYSFSRQDNPDRNRIRFREQSATLSGIDDPTDLNAVPLAFKNNLANTTLYDNRVQSSEVDEDRYTAQLDLTYDLPVLAAGKVTGRLKTGAKLRTVSRSRDVTQRFLRPYLRGENPAIGDPTLFATTEAGEILLANFLNPDLQTGDFFGGEFDFLPGSPEARRDETVSLEGVDLARFNELFGTTFAATDALSYDGVLDPGRARAFYDLYRDRYDLDPSVDAEDYFGDERITAGYAMAEFNVGKFMLLGGLRYELTEQNYTSVSATPLAEDAGGPGTVNPVLINADIRYDDVLPMAHLKYTPTEWMDVRAAVTQTLARPNFQSLVPWEFVNPNDQTIRSGNPELPHTTATNYDLFLSFYNRFGLLTVGGFRKDLENVDFIQSSNFIDSENPNNLFNGFSVTAPASVPEAFVEGVELDLQGNLLPLESKLLNGLVFGINATVLRSETQYPLIVNIPERPNPAAGQPGEPFFLPAERIDSLRGGRLVGQPDLIMNLMLGYERRGFSGRVSAVYQGDALSPGNPGIGSGDNGVGDRAEEDAFDSSFWRMDITVKQQLGRTGNWSVMLNVNNVLNTPEQAFLAGTRTGLLTENEFFGVTADLGVAFRFRK